VIIDDALRPDGPLDFRLSLESQRGRILDGMARAVAENGYAATAVADVLDQCRMSRRTFYRHFPNKEECFLAAYDFAARHVGDRVARTFLSSGPDWRTQIRRAFQAFMAFVVAEPHFARLCLVEVLAAGPRALERRDAAVARFTLFLEQAAATAPGPHLVPPAVPEAIVGGVQTVITSRLLHGRAFELPDLVDDLMFWGMVPFVGHAAARQQNTSVS
jgi:AcrR family transcriptional regulator